MTSDPAENGPLSAEARATLEARAKALAQPLEEESPRGDTVELVGFSSAGARYAVEATQVVEVVAVDDPTPVPGTPPAVLGVVNHRGRIVTVVDVARLLGLPRQDTLEGALVVVTSGEATFAIRTESTPEIVSLERRDLLPAAGVLDEQDSVVRGVTGSMVAVLDVEAIARDPRIAVDEQVEW